MLSCSRADGLIIQNQEEFTFAHKIHTHLHLRPQLFVAFVVDLSTI